MMQKDEMEVAQKLNEYFKTFFDFNTKVFYLQFAALSLLTFSYQISNHKTSVSVRDLQ